MIAAAPARPHLTMPPDEAAAVAPPVTVRVDDYIDRPAYHEVERLAPRAAMIGRMARFDLTPQPFPAAQMAWLMGLFLRPG